MNADRIVVIEGDALDYLRWNLTREVERGRVYRISVVEDGGVKIKINESVWTPPFAREESS